MTNSTGDVGLSTVTDNHVFLRGDLPGAAQMRVIASGAEVAAFQLVVKRPEGAGSKADTLDCACSTAALRRQVTKYAEGDRLEITGRLQRRFWRTGAGVASRYEVEVDSLRRVKKAG